MNIFDDLIYIDKIGNIHYNQWIEWNHFLIPNKPELLRKIMRKLMAFLSHCSKCTALDGCYLLSNNKPELPLHTNCDCDTIFIDFKKVQENSNAEFPIIKFTNYIFAGGFESKGKHNIFQSWGYTKNDIPSLKKEFENQTLQNYKSGNYKLKKLDQYGQRLAIPINLKGKIFYSGWMLCPDGKIRNTTPFGGWIK